MGSAGTTEQGICWNTTGFPTTSGSKSTTTVACLAPPACSISEDLTGLTEGETYYVRAYATSPDGTGYGNQLILNTMPSFSTYLMTLQFEGDQISGTPTFTIQDQSTYNHDAVYTLGGTQPYISITLGALESTGEETEIQQIDVSLPGAWAEGGQAPLFGDDQDHVGEGSAFYPLVKAISDLSGVDVQLCWIMLYIALQGIIIIVVGKALSGHMLIMGSCTIFVTLLFVAFGPLDWWLVILNIIGVVALIQWERQPTM